MTGWVRKKMAPKVPKSSSSPTKAVPVGEQLEPTIDDATQVEETLMRLRRRKGLTSTFLTRMFGRPSASTTGPATALRDITPAATPQGGGTVDPAGRVYTPRSTSRYLSR